MITLQTFNALAKNGVAFASVTENIDYSSPEGRLFVAMLGAFAQYFSDSLAKHTRKASTNACTRAGLQVRSPSGMRKARRGCPFPSKVRLPQ